MTNIFNPLTGVFLGDVNPATGRTMFDDLKASIRSRNLAQDIRLFKMLEKSEEATDLETCSILNRHAEASIKGASRLATEYVKARGAAYKKFMGRAPNFEEMTADAKALGIIN